MSDQIVKRPPMIDLEEFERRLRQPLAANQRVDDPLAELARSFAGGEEDPYKTGIRPELGGMSRIESKARCKECDSPSSVAISPRSRRAC